MNQLTLHGLTTLFAVVDWLMMMQLNQGGSKLYIEVCGYYSLCHYYWDYKHGNNVQKYSQNCTVCTSVGSLPNANAGENRESR